MEGRTQEGEEEKEDKNEDEKHKRSRRWSKHGEDTTT